MIGLVTVEMPGKTASGGIGAAMQELATFCQKNSIAYKLILVVRDENVLKADELGANIEAIYVNQFTSNPDTNEAKSFAVYQYLKHKKYKKIFISDYAGLGFYSTRAKSMGLFFLDTQFITVMHGPTRWAIELNAQGFPNTDALITDWLESQSAQSSDIVIYLSEYLKSWVKEHKWIDRDGEVLSNLMGSVGGREFTVNKRRVSDIVVFGRHEFRKNIKFVVDSFSLLANEFPEIRSVNLVFLGGLSEISGMPSELYISEKLGSSKINFKILPDISRDECLNYFKQAKQAAVIIPSVENCPYTVLEAIDSGVPVYVAREGGASELLSNDSISKNTFKLNRDSFFSLIKRIVLEGGDSVLPSNRVIKSEIDWLRILNRSPINLKKKNNIENNPLVSLVVITFNRPLKAIEALESCLDQEYKNKVITLVDDGSDKSIDGYESLIDFCNRNGINYVYQKNSYLGAARNTGVTASSADYYIFLDDDDLFVKNSLGGMVRAALRTGLDVLIGISYYMNANSRAIINHTQSTKVSYLPTGGPISVAAIRNSIGPSVSLISKRVFEIVKYTELYGVGHEDYEFYINVVNAGFKLDVYPEPIFYYEVGIDSMITNTPVKENFMRSYSAIDFSKYPESAKDLVGILLNDSIKSVSNSRQRAYSNLPAPIDSMYREFNRFAGDTRIKMLYKYAEHFEDKNLQSIVTSSLKMREELKLRKYEKAPDEIKRKSLAHIFYLVKNLVFAEQLSKDNEEILFELRRYLNENAISDQDVGYLFKIIDELRSRSLSSDILIMEDLLFNKISDGRKVISLLMVAAYFSESKSKFSHLFKTLLEGEANDFRNADNYLESSNIEIVQSVLSCQTYPSWAFQNLLLATRIISNSKSDIENIKILNAFVEAIDV
jgi:glycosyltransferase involved in cell wall biosynthesis